MPYRALYRQWRPKDFSHVVGQHAVIETLRNQVINDRIAHAYLFYGPSTASIRKTEIPAGSARTVSGWKTTKAWT